jgi:hypothetical protein
MKNENAYELKAKEKEYTKIIQGAKKVLETISRFISNASTSSDVCIDQTRPVLGTDISQIRALILNSHNRGIRLRCITEITANNMYYCKQLLDMIDKLRHLDNIVGTFYVSDKECLFPESIHKSRYKLSNIRTSHH